MNKNIIEEKYKRILNLKEWGYNTPKLMKIAKGTNVDEILIKNLYLFAGNANKMTVRTYSATDEILEFATDFFPEVPLDEAIKKVIDSVGKYHVLFQEAINKETTLITGNIALKKDRTGFYDILRGPYRVRDVDNPPKNVERESVIFSRLYEIHDLEMIKIILDIKDIPFLVPYDGVIIEFDLHNEYIGENKDKLILWEYKPLK